MHREADAVVPRVLDAAGIDRAVLFGHSDGASIALLTAARWPARVVALVLEAPHLFVEPLSLASIAAIRERYAHGDLRRRLAAHHDHVDEVFYGWNDVWLSPSFRPWSIEEAVGRVACPVLAVQGDDDEYGTAAQLHALERHVPAAVTTVLIQKCGHSPHRDQPAVVLDHVAAFLRRWEP
jgi:pimeloyl-ACP methyl ester carboxylesterase